MSLPESATKVDYLVTTFPKTLKNQAIYPKYLGMVDDGNVANVRNFYGRQKGKLFVGDSYDRYMIAATSYTAHEFLAHNDIRELDEISVARLDIQVTIKAFRVDQTIELVRPPKLYQCTLIVSLYGEGTTLYIGAPSSRVRARLYNKTAESGKRAEDGSELLRIEFQLRDRYADFALTSLYAGQIDRLMLSHTKKMTDDYIASLVERAIRETDTIARVAPTDEIEASPIARRIGWLNHSVRPAIMKLAILDRAAAIDFLEKVLYDIRNTNNNEQI